MSPSMSQNRIRVTKIQAHCVLCTVGADVNTEHAIQTLTKRAFCDVVVWKKEKKKSNQFFMQTYVIWRAAFEATRAIQFPFDVQMNFIIHSTRVVASKWKIKFSLAKQYSFAKLGSILYKIHPVDGIDSMLLAT